MRASDAGTCSPSDLDGPARSCIHGREKCWLHEKTYHCRRGVELDTRGLSDRIILTCSRQTVPFWL